MKELQMLVVALVIALCGACTNVSYVTYHTQPTGAMITERETGVQFGMSPVRVSYVWDKRNVVNGCLQVKGMSAQWVSGAKSESPNIIRVCGKGEQQYQIPYPQNSTDAAKDMEFALKVQQLRMQQSLAARQADLMDLWTIQAAQQVMGN